MLKRLSFLGVALIALAACSHNGSDNTASPQPAPAQSSAPAAPASAAKPAPAATTPAPAAASTAAAAASSTATPPAASTTAQKATTSTPAEPFVDNGKWVEGKNYFTIEPAQPTGIPDRIVVTEAFSYACPACNAFHTTADQLAQNLPSNAVMTYLPVSFRPDENFPLFQRAYFAAKALGVADKTYDAMFDAIWKSGELASDDLNTGRPKPQSAWPTIDDVAKFYAKHGVDPKEFVAVANSFSINTQMKRADDMVKAYGVDATPTIIVNGKYRFTPGDAGGYGQSIELAKWLVAKEAAGK
ncbi:thiol:disulfide interchange protein DsbA/DsbL [Dyella psychrodurans]|uniref:Thiol:disulfide interchange protein DsbA/DsbL n=1 Tax=Dyella psychrodurans TaxID=1927960 RepID=A0A370X4N9_9GAMM|nr:thiol:disulfide interchange protein DsbA/DsbL [Dyella psychrodurans]RDS83247.1 thiol:disulfide interchange protein DsbA/DsbL [Dyella psychrodurans]